MHSIAQASGSALSILAAAGFGCGETEDRAQPFAAGEQADNASPCESSPAVVFLRQISIERAIDHFLPGLEIRLSGSYERQMALKNSICR